LEENINLAQGKGSHVRKNDKTKSVLVI